jgi:DnaJ-class molecular chaperone
MLSLRALMRFLFHSRIPKPKPYRCPSCGSLGHLREFVICFLCQEYVCGHCGDNEDVGHHICGRCLEHGTLLHEN